jgi:hypothetical protein
LLFLLLPPFFGKNAKLHVHSGYKNLEEGMHCKSDVFFLH